MKNGKINHISHLKHGLKQQTGHSAAFAVLFHVVHISVI